MSLSLSDPDGDAVSVTNVTVDRNCLTSRRAGNDVYVTPQGQVTGVTPTLTGTNSCDVQVVVHIQDPDGATNTCSKTITVNYPPPRVDLVKLYDRNPYEGAGFDSQPANPLKDTQFVYIGGIHQDTYTTNGAKLQNPTLPTRTLLPAHQRFDITGYTGSDHNPIRVLVNSEPFVVSGEEV